MLSLRELNTRYLFLLGTLQLFQKTRDEFYNWRRTCIVGHTWRNAFFLFVPVCTVFRVFIHTVIPLSIYIFAVCYNFFFLISKFQRPLIVSLHIISEYRQKFIISRERIRIFDTKQSLLQIFHLGDRWNMSFPRYVIY